MKLILVVAFLVNISLNALYLKEDEFNEKTYVRTYGNVNNEAIIFVHGMGDEASTTWDETIEALRDDYYIVTFDLPGFGKSTKSNQLYSMERYVKFIHNIANKYIDKKYHLVGHSMGGAISLKYAYTYQDELQSLVLIDVAGVLSKQAFSQFLIKNGVSSFFGTSLKDLGIDVAIAKIPKALESIIPFDVTKLISSSKAREFIFQSNPTAISAMSLVNEDFSYIPQNIYLNTRIIWGEDDNIAPLRTGYILNKRIENSKLNIIKDSKHVPIVDSFEIYISYIKEHLKDPSYSRVTKTNLTKEKKDMILEDVNGRIISGNIDELELINCKNIILKDANINKFTITNSRVTIMNSNFNIKEISYIIDSNVEITASNINLLYPIEVLNSDLDLAGVDFISEEEIFKNLNTNNKQNVIFSLSKNNSELLHGEYQITKDSSVLNKQEN